MKFTIPKLSGSGSQACAGYADVINNAFLLGKDGAQLEIGKWEGYNVPLGAILVGS